MDLFDIATGLNLGCAKVKTYFKDSTKNCKFNISCTQYALGCNEQFNYLVLKDVSHFKYNVKRKILSLYYED